MKKEILTLSFFVLSLITYSQFQIGHTTITFNDPARTGGFGTGGGPGRQIQTEIYYPANAAGENVSLLSGEFPVVVFGHGFAMSWDAYENIWEELVPEGFIVAFPRTEGGLIPGPSHQDFGLDLALVETRMEAEGNLSTSLFLNHISGKSAIMGHSMGGGATFLAAANNSNITTIIGLSPAETTPSAITAAANVTVPTLVFSADQDMVTPAVDHHIPIYNGLSSSCKYFVNIVGGGHCYYANSNLNCDFGEATSGGSISISRTEQQATMNRYVLPWLKMYLFDDCAQQTVFTNDLPNDLEVTYQSSCSGFPTPNFDLNVTVNGLSLSSNENGAIYQWIDCTNGNAIIPSATNQMFTATQSGSYAVVLGSGICADTSSCYTVSTLGINENANSIERKLLMITDILGREVKFQPNQTLIYIYSDGTREKVFRIE